MRRFLIAEYCRGPFYMGWHLYLRENRAFTPNSDGGWGWLSQIRENSQVTSFFSSIGIIITGDGTCDGDGIAEFAGRFPIEGRRCGGKLRGGIEVDVGEYGEIKAGYAREIRRL